MLIKTHRDSLRLIETHRDSSRLIETHRDSSRLIKTHQVSSRFIKIHRDSSRLFETCRDSSRLVQTQNLCTTMLKCAFRFPKLYYPLEEEEKWVVAALKLELNTKSRCFLLSLNTVVVQKYFLARDEYLEVL